MSTKLTQLVMYRAKAHVAEDEVHTHTPVAHVAQREERTTHVVVMPMPHEGMAKMAKAVVGYVPPGAVA